MGKVLLTSVLIQPKHHLMQLYPLQNVNGVVLDTFKGL